MKNSGAGKRTGGAAAALIGAVLLLVTAHAAAAQIRIGGVEITIPKRTRPPRAEKPPARAETPIEAGTPSAAPAAEEAKTHAPARSAGARPDAGLEAMLDDIKRKKSEVDEYDPSAPNRAFEITTPYYILPAVSTRARQEYFRRMEVSDARRAALGPALDALAASVAVKLPSYRPKDSVFAYRSAAGEQMIKGSLKNAATLKTHRVGFAEASWLIEKNEFGIPLNRYMHGYVWARDAADDLPYCHLYVVYLQQNYAGGGKYGRAFADIRDDQIVGCP